MGRHHQPAFPSHALAKTDVGKRNTWIGFFNRGIKHDFPFINICKVPREVLKTEGKARALRMLMNDKIMFDRYYYINAANHCENEENIGALYFITSSHILREYAFKNHA